MHRLPSFLDVLLDDVFPVYFFNYTQKEKNLKRLHYHNSFEIGLCLEGSGLFFIENKALSFNIGDMTFIYPNQPHMATSPNELPSRWVFINVDFHRLFARENFLTDTIWERRGQIPFIVSPALCPSISQIVTLIIDELTSKEVNYPFVVRELFAAFAYKISGLALEKADNTPGYTDEFAAISPSLSYIAQNYSKNIFISDLSNICNLSEPYFRVLFKKAVGRTPLQQISYIRLKMAKTLLKSTNLSILSISQSVGYESISSFNRAFKSQFGCSPSEYRR